MFFWISILVVTVFCGQTSAVVDKRFPTNRNGDKMTHVVEKDGFLFVAENGILHQLDFALTYINSFDTCASDDCNNINKVLAVSGDLLVLCGTGNNGVCQALNGSKVVYSSSSDNSEGNYLAVSTDIKKSAVGIAFEGDFYLGVTYGQDLGLKMITGKTYKYYISRTEIDTGFTPKGSVFLLNEEYLVYFKKVFQHDRYIYFLTNQRDNVTSTKFVSKLIRICVDEIHNPKKEIKSYTDIVLSCELDGVGYNLLQDADFLHAKGVIVAAFSQGDDPANPSADSAVCVYTMEAVNNAILLAKEDFLTCATKNYEGQASAYNEIDLKRCLSKSEYQDLKEDYLCPMEHSLSGSKVIGYTSPLQPSSTYKVDNTIITKVKGIDRYGLYPDVFIGTDIGTISKITLGNSLEVFAYQTDIVVDKGHTITDIHIGEDRAYTVTSRKISMFRNTDCSIFKSCKDLIEAMHPSCGWCLSIFRGTKKSDCSSGWISSLSECVSIKVSPKYIPISEIYTSEVTITVKNIPQNSTTGLTCKYIVGGNQVGGLISTTRYQEKSLRCPISSPMEHVELTLQLVTEQSLMYAESTIQIYDCRFYTSCGSCLPSPEVNCHWCATSLTCQTSSSSCAMQVTDVAGCSRLETSEIYLPNGMTKEISLNVTNMVTSLAYGCSIEQNETHVEVPANVDRNIIKCALNVLFVGDHSKMGLPLSVYQVKEQTKVKIENTVQVTVYKCEYLAADCTMCGALKPNRYDCKWCQSGQCGHTSQCRQNVSCPLPQITQVYPPSGGYIGGTQLQITGTNFGTSSNSISDVIVGDLRCNEMNVLQDDNPDFYHVNKEIRCVLGRNNKERVGTKNVTFAFDGIRCGYGNYSFLNPVVTKIEPSFGPAIGGTLITLSGTDLDIEGSIPRVRLGYIGYCLNVLRHNNRLTCITPTKSRALDVTFVRLLWGDEMYTSSVTFRLLTTPSITELSSRKSILSGGTVVHAVGKSLNNAANVVIIAHYAGDKEVAECITSMKTSLECPFPQAPLTAVEEMVKNTQGNRKRRSLIDTSIRIDISIKMDGYVKTFEVDYYRDPVVESFRESIIIPYFGQKSLTITGNYLNLVGGLDDYKVLISDGNCLVIDVARSNITCIPPDDNPDKTAEKLEVEVQLGNFKQTVGYVRYEANVDSPVADNANYTLRIVLSGVSVVLFIAIIIGVVLFCYKYRRAKARIPKIKIQKRKKSEELNEISTSRPQTEPVVDNHSSALNVVERSVYMDLDENRGRPVYQDLDHHGHDNLDVSDCQGLDQRQDDDNHVYEGLG